MTPTEPRGGEGLTAEIVADHRRLATWNISKDRPKRVAFHHDAASHIERLQADSDRLRAFSPSSPPSGGGGWPSREAIAETFRKHGLEGFDDLEAAILALFPPVVGWRPIETAPRDGTKILLWDEGKEAAVSGFWHVEPTMDTPSAYEPGWAFWVTDNDLIIWDGGEWDTPTFWMPLPAAPLTTEGVE